MALNYADMQFSGQMRQRQEAIATPEVATGRASIVSASTLMLAAYRANQFGESERLARKILEAPKVEQADTPGTAHFTHGAYTILGLVVLNRNDIVGAKKFLDLSIAGLQPDRTISGGQPGFALAEGLLKSGEKDAVAAFISACLKVNGCNQSKDKLRMYSDEILSGKRSTFAPDDFLMF